MKRWIYLLVGLLVAVAGVGSCKKSVSGTRRLGKWVDFAGCGHYIVQLMDVTPADSNVVTASWTDTSSNVTYTNVFGVTNVCNFAPATADSLRVGDEFEFTLNGPVPEVVCFMCNIWPFAMPAASNSVTNIQVVTPQ